MALFVLPTAAAQAAPFTISIDNAILDLGGLKGVRAIDSEIEPPDPPATLTGELTGDAVNVPKDDFEFPEKSITDPIAAQIDMFANEDITGTYDSSTGLLVLDANLKATVEVFGSTCVISPIVLQLRSDTSKPYLGQAFTGGIEGTGIVGATWTGLPPVTGGGTCGAVAGLIAGPGGIAMSHGVHAFQTCETDPENPLCDKEGNPPSAKPKILTQPPASTKSDVASFSYEKGATEQYEVTGFECSLDGSDFQACDSGSKTYTGLGVGSHSFLVRSTNEFGHGDPENVAWEITKDVPPPTKPELGPLTVKPKNKKVKRGKSVTITAKVKNVGDGAASGVKVCVKAPKRLVKVKKCVTKGGLAPGATATVKFKAKVPRKARRKAKATLVFKVTGTGLKAKTAKSVIKVG